MTPTTTRPRRLILRDDEAAALAGAGRAEVWREMKRQPRKGHTPTLNNGVWWPSFNGGCGLMFWVADGPFRCPWKPGDAAWGAEAWSPDHRAFYPNHPIVYRADGYPAAWEIVKGRVHGHETNEWYSFRWRSAMLMNRQDSRLPRLVVAAVSVEERGGRWGWQIEVERSEAR